MGMKRISLVSQIILLPFIIVMLIMLLSSVLEFSQRGERASLERIETTIEKYAVQCYASEGSYPPDLTYLVNNYGLILDEEKYYYEYNIFASNIRPDIHVFSRIN